MNPLAAESETIEVRARRCAGTSDVGGVIFRPHCQDVGTVSSSHLMRNHHRDLESALFLCHDQGVLQRRFLNRCIFLSLIKNKNFTSARQTHDFRLKSKTIKPSLIASCPAQATTLDCSASTISRLIKLASLTTMMRPIHEEMIGTQHMITLSLHTSQGYSGLLPSSAHETAVPKRPPTNSSVIVQLSFTGPLLNKPPFRRRIISPQNHQQRKDA